MVEGMVEYKSMDFSGPCKGQWLFLVIGDRWGRDCITPPLEGKDYTWYIRGIFPAYKVIIYYQSHPLQGPEKELLT